MPTKFGNSIYAYKSSKWGTPTRGQKFTLVRGADESGSELPADGRSAIPVLTPFTSQVMIEHLVLIFVLSTNLIPFTYRDPSGSFWTLLHPI